MRAVEPRFHTAEHILTGVVGLLFNGIITDSRFKENKVRCDYQVDLTIPIEEFVEKIEKKANEIVSKKLPVSFEYVDKNEATQRCRLHRLPAEVEKIRLVKIGDLITTPCTGEHVLNTSEIGGRLRIKNSSRVTQNTIRLMFTLESEIRVRIAPSPTGLPHIGNIRTGFYNFLFARHHRGEFYMRIEDTDRERLIPESLPKILEMFQWLGIKYDNQPYIQSEHLDNYQRAAHELVEKNLAYYCFCTEERLEKLRAEQSAKHLAPRYDRHCLTLSGEEVAKRLERGKKFVIRLKIPDNRDILWNDLIRGKVSVNSKELDDQVLLKSDGFPTYHLAVVYDDNLMRITHILRGMEWLPSTPKHILLYEALGYEKPQWGHLPLILGPDRAKLSKRHGAQSALEYRDAGYLPEAVLNTLLFWGWSPKDNQQFFTMEEMIKKFDLDGINKNDPIIDLKKLDYFNGYYIRQKKDTELLKLLYPFMGKDETIKGDEFLLKIIPLIKDRLKKLSDWHEMTKGFFVRADIKQIFTLLSGLDAKYCVSTKNVLIKIADYLKNPSIWKNSEIWQTGLRKIADEFKLKHGDLFMVLRIAIWGDKITPPLYETMNLLGQEESLRRIEQIIK